MPNEMKIILLHFTSKIEISQFILLTWLHIEIFLDYV